MIKFHRVTLLIFILTIICFSSSAFATTSTYEGMKTVDVDVNNISLNGDVPAVIMMDRTMVPLKFVSEALGAEVTWDSKTFTVYVKSKPSDNTNIKVPISSTTFEGNRVVNVVVDNEQIKGDVPAVIINNRTMVPLKFVSEALGAEVSWNATLKKAIVKTIPIEQVTENSNQNNNQSELKEESNETPGQAFALRIVKLIYGDSNNGSSREEVINHLMRWKRFDENMTPIDVSLDEAIYGVDNCGIDWIQSNEVSEEVVADINISSTNNSVDLAVQTATNYIAYNSFSKNGLFTLLTQQGYSYEQATYAVENCGANWMEQAIKRASSLLENKAYSKNELVNELRYERINGLTFDGFTHDEAVYGVDNCGANWMEQAVKRAKSRLNFDFYSKLGLIQELQLYAFTNAEATYGAENCEADWMNQAAETAKYFTGCRDGLISYLQNMKGFTSEEAIFGADSMEN